MPVLVETVLALSSSICKLIGNEELFKRVGTFLALRIMTPSRNTTHWRWQWQFESVDRTYWATILLYLQSTTPSGSCPCVIQPKDQPCWLCSYKDTILLFNVIHEKTMVTQMHYHDATIGFLNNLCFPKLQQMRYGVLRILMTSFNPLSYI